MHLFFQKTQTDHIFSKHDNRNSFPTDALYFEQVLNNFLNYIWSPFK